MDRRVRVNDTDPLAFIRRLGETSRATRLNEQLARYREALKGDEPSLHRAAFFGASADRIALGIAIAYFESTRVRLGGVPFASLGVTERGGAHPRAIQTEAERMEDGAYALRGEKRFITLGRHCTSILVLAKEEKLPDGRFSFGLYRVAAERALVDAEDLPETPFTPELPHTAIRLSDLRVPHDARLPGDGYADWVRDFGVVEEHHILASILGYRLGLQRVHGLRPNQAITDAFRSILALDPFHETLESLELLGHAGTLLLDEITEDGALKIPEEELARYRRDLRILQLGAGRRMKRLEKLRSLAD